MNATTANDNASKGFIVGETREVNGVRIHCYASAIHATDVRNAGKRGKRCAELSIYEGPREAPWAEIADAIHAVASLMAWRDVKACVLDMLDEYPQARLQERDHRGVDVVPSYAKIVIDTPALWFEASPVEVACKNRADRINEPSCYSRKRTDAAKLYAYFAANRPATWADVRAGEKACGVAMHHYCAVD